VKYRVSALCTISVFTDVEADSPGEAKRLAQKRGMIGLCHQCAGGNVDEEWCTSGELDGTPRSLAADTD
jgi:hypothetical protein